MLRCCLAPACCRCILYVPKYCTYTTVLTVLECIDRGGGVAVLLLHFPPDWIGHAFSVITQAQLAPNGRIGQSGSLFTEAWSMGSSSMMRQSNPLFFDEPWDF